MIGASESFVAGWTDESLLAGVCPKMTLQLVAASESLAAEQPVADEGPFAGMPSQVRLEVRRLSIDLSDNTARFSPELSQQITLKYRIISIIKYNASQFL